MIVDKVNMAARRIPAWLLYIYGAAHIGWLFYLALTGAMGVEPIKALEHAYGENGLKWLIAGLAITPLRRFANLNLIKFRRAVGLVTFSYISAHLLVWLILDVQLLAEIWKDIVKRPYITIGMAAFVAMIPLAMTSNNWSVRKLGPKWRSMHKLVYLIAVLGAVHFIMLRKGLQIEPLIYLAIVLVLLTPRFLKKRKKARA